MGVAKGSNFGFEGSFLAIVDLRGLSSDFSFKSIFKKGLGNPLNTPISTYRIIVTQVR